jgi:hypothetical protein
MISVKFDHAKIIKDLNNAVEYSIGFIDGVESGKKFLLANLGRELKILVAEFIDSNARVSPESLHHVYEWYQTGSPAARLFDIDYFVVGGGLSVDGTLRQSRSTSRNSNTPFYDKARIMERGTSVTIAPKKAQALRFEENGQPVFTKSPITINNPGGSEVQGSFQETFRQFFLTFSSQSLLEISGLADNLKRPVEFKDNFAAGVRGGRPVGFSTGLKFISEGAR